MKSRVVALTLSRYFLSLVLALGVSTAVSPAKSEGLIEGKCGILESGSAFSRCTVISKGGDLAVLANNGGNLIFQARNSEILRIGSLSPRAEAISPGIKTGFRATLSALSISESDARRSSNVRLIQARGNSATVKSLLFIADRDTRNLDQLNANLTPIDNYTSSSDTASILVPSDSSKILEEFERAFQRIQSLYDALMFEEADRVFDRTEAEIRNFSKRFKDYQGSLEVTAVLNAKSRQLELLRNSRLYDYEISRAQAEQRYDRIQREKAEAEARRRRQEYLMAVEYRKAAEANARKWWAIWMATRPALINNVTNTNVIITR